MSYSTQRRYQLFVKGYGLLSFAKSIDKKMSVKYSQKHLNHAKEAATDAFKAASIRAIQKPAEATGNLIGNKIAKRITKVSKHS